MSGNAIPVKSSTVESVGYDATTQRLTVTYKGGGTYHYAGVSPTTHAALMAADSVGGYLHAHVKGKHAHTKAP